MEGQNTYKEVFQFSKVDSMIHVIVFFFRLVEHGILEGTVEENTVLLLVILAECVPPNSYILKYYVQCDGIRK